MISLNLLDEATYKSIRLSLLKNVEEKKDENGQPILSKTVYFDGDADGLGNPTIGIGMNLRDSAVRGFVAGWMLERYDITDPNIIKATSAEIKTAVDETSSYKTATSLQEELNRIMANKSGNPSATCSFSDEQEVEGAFVGLAEKEYEKRVSTWYGSTIDYSYERLALLSLTYNGSLGPKLRTAIQEGDRPEAWYQIRYQTNGGASRSGGIAKRRYYESQIFSLYDIRDSAGAVSDAEARSIDKMHKAHATAIDTYDTEFEKYVGKANTDYGSVALGDGKVQNFRESLERSKNYVVTNYFLDAASKKINQISFASSYDGIAIGSALATDPLVVPLKVKAPAPSLLSREQPQSPHQTSHQKSALDTQEVDDDTFPQTFDDDTSYYADDDVFEEDLAPVNSLLIGDLATDTFYIASSLSGSDHIVSTVGDGKIVIGNVALSGKAHSKRDAATNEIIPNQWTLGGFNLARVGDDLEIYQSGTSRDKADAARVVVKNYPFDLLQLTNQIYLKNMIKILRKSLALAVIASYFLAAEFAFAESAISEKATQVKTLISFTKNNKDAQDPDLKLSIEELRKKYPIDWLEKKYGDYNCCESNDCKPDPKRVCGFTSEPKEVREIDGLGSILLFDPFQKLNEAQVKSIIINYTQKYEYDLRADHLLVLIVKRINDIENQAPLTQKIRNFFYSDKILSSYEYLSCDVLVNFNPKSKYYEKLALGYFRASFKKSIIIQKYSINSLLRNCISPSKRGSIEDQFISEFKSKIKS